ncbi:hypothetical protein, partial [Nitrosospira multiformis]
MPDDAASIDLQISDRLWNGISRRGDTNKKWTGENTNPFRMGLFIINGGQGYSLDLFLRRTRLMEAIPMSPIDSILGIDGLVVQSVKRAQGIHVWA